MLKLLNGIVTFHQTLSISRAQAFAKLALGQTPDAAFVGCSDSRVDPRIFASKDPGDVFVHRNVGNLIPACNRRNGTSDSGHGAWAFVEYALLQLNVAHLIVCGHSECGAMLSLWNNARFPKAPNLGKWLVHGKSSLGRLDTVSPDELRLHHTLSPHNRLSQLNVLEQMDHLKTHPLVRERLAEGALYLHGWYFNIATASVQAYDEEQRRFLLIDREHVKRIRQRISGKVA